MGCEVHEAGARLRPDQPHAEPTDHPFELHPKERVQLFRIAGLGVDAEHRRLAQCLFDPHLPRVAFALAEARVVVVGGLDDLARVAHVYPDLLNACVVEHLHVVGRRQEVVVVRAAAVQIVPQCARHRVDALTRERVRDGPVVLDVSAEQDEPIEEEGPARFRHECTDDAGQASVDGLRSTNAPVELVGQLVQQLDRIGHVPGVTVDPEVPEPRLETGPAEVRDLVVEARQSVHAAQPARAVTRCPVER